MNYFAHGRDYLDRPYFVAGTAVPDWLSVVDRRMRVRQRTVQRFDQDDDPRVATVAAGILQHLHDDDWFHQTRAFAELSLELTRDIRQVLPEDDGFRPSFLGHILVEILLDAVLIDQNPGRLDDYYATLARVDPQVVADAVNRMATRSSGLLSVFIPRFLAERFLYDYLDDEKLLWRLNHVMRRVQLVPLPERFMQIFPEARKRIQMRRDELLAGPPDIRDAPDPTEGDPP
jgi:hypothetical protein